MSVTGQGPSWWHRRRFAWVLLPVSALFALLTGLRRWAYRRGWLKVIRLPVPVVIVGNISVGGSGKTPVVQALVRALQGRGYRPGIVSRGYAAKVGAQPVSVQAQPSAERVGDEPLLHWRTLSVPVYVHPDRVAAAQALVAGAAVDIIVADDGLQHYRLGRDCEIVVEGNYGNGWLLPAGPLREPRRRALCAEIILGDAGIGFSRSLGAATQLSTGQSRALAFFSESVVDAVAGIATPENFFLELERAGLNIRRHAFADHYHFSAADFAHMAGPVLMTEKDAVKCLNFSDARLWSVALEVNLPDSVVECVIKCCANKE